MRHHHTRRQFLSKTATATAGLVAAGLTAPTIRADGKAPASERIRIGLIGCGGRGRQLLDIAMTLPQVQVVAVNDIDSQRLEATAAQVKKAGGDRPQVFADFRKLLDQKDVDAVIIGSPDHWHALHTIYACLAGKDVYVEKPVGHNVAEGRAMVKAARRSKRIVQVGMQQRSAQVIQEAMKIVWSGKLGRITQSRTWNFSRDASMAKVADGEPPSGVDYEAWLGPAPKRPFNRNRFHGTFRWYFDYASGMIGDWNVHIHDMIHWALKVTGPKSVVASGGKYYLTDDRDTPDTMEVIYEYETASGPVLHVYSLRKGNAIAAWGPPVPRANRGSYMHYGMQFHGSDATLFLDRDRYEVIPNAALEKGHAGTSVAGKGETNAMTLPHIQNWLECIKTRSLPTVDAEIGHTTAAACHLANISLRVGRKLYWDAGKEQCYTDPEHKTPDVEANRLLGREHRKPWELPAV